MTECIFEQFFERLSLTDQAFFRAVGLHRAILLAFFRKVEPHRAIFIHFFPQERPKNAPERPKSLPRPSQERPKSGQGSQVGAQRRPRRSKMKPESQHKRKSGNAKNIQKPEENQGFLRIQEVWTFPNRSQRRSRSEAGSLCGCFFER